MICVPCKKIYRPEKNGVYFEEMMPVKNKLHPNAEGWHPYKLWVGDRLKCPGCGHEVIAGVPMQPIVEHYMAEYETLKQKLNPELQVNDCGNLQMGVPRLTEDNTRKQEREQAAERITVHLDSIEADIAAIRDASAELL